MPPSTRTSPPRAAAPAISARADSTICSAMGEEMASDVTVFLQVEDQALQRARGVVAAGVQTPGSAELACVGRLVDVAVEAGDRLVALDRVANRRAAHRDLDRRTAVQHGPELVVELWR